MKKLICIIVCFTIFLPVVFALDYDVIYMEGFPIVKGAGGTEDELYVGSTVKTGDTIITESGDTVELESGEIRLKISEDSVFTIIEKEEEGV